MPEKGYIYHGGGASVIQSGYQKAAGKMRGRIEKDNRGKGMSTVFTLPRKLILENVI